ncbi:MAG: hypothetical protein JSS04_19770 [Proteobacteria bacterium]|nr:hypothetical protein [Pseudomonadota bacterium]
MFAISTETTAIEEFGNHPIAWAFSMLVAADAFKVSWLDQQVAVEHDRYSSSRFRECGDNDIAPRPTASAHTHFGLRVFSGSRL